jgi:hypothetical protein
MDHEPIYSRLEGITKLSSALKAYLDIALKEVSFKKNQLIPSEFLTEHPLVFVKTGNVKTQFESLKEPGQYVVRFHFQGSLIPQYADLNPKDYSLERISLDDAVLTVLPLRHEFNVYKLFPEYHRLTGEVQAYHLAVLLNFIYQFRFEEGQLRLNHLLEIEPKLFQIASVQDISAAVGVHPHTLSKYTR